MLKFSFTKMFSIASYGPFNSPVCKICLIFDFYIHQGNFTDDKYINKIVPTQYD